MDTPITGSGGVDRIPAASPALKSTNKEAEAAASSAVDSIHSVKEMKLAEYRGEEITISDEQMVKALERAIKAVEGKNTSLNFSIHEKTKQIMVKVIDKESGQIIREVPPEKNLDFLAKLWEMAGILVDEKR
ncbi:flagellar protein FlaG [Paenibacillus mucilaginosus]|uniref:Flagellar protein FlaG protein n=3 Tax=Paenibacillus mucilaginosus TaxID=61624 RepID=H6NT79_9BACL|nr:flagellar protein FlaG [Paenibacillus mucilaginosus]AEI38762.1 flagellar protein FlaG protein [Paenibacillus mucilaginosus KNP414]AFC27092.1 flagellar protein FlaG protein [Paenibacillus mucilaginosus 3016]AFH59230.1 flagellar protein FlaG [Paenibacillus mucilaginosus K02]MCG7215898.1 flagellar protein FlaG [Paenibacillus mucilaginosus]WDM27845.1 flagellar protein FlaG [Paenibacillus mucilaginosus]